ncbi:MAG: VWA domain-containing protein [Acidobacteriia bacterium]|nr:VWA domain-containing protein [Terriglobia bacterium]
MALRRILRKPGNGRPITGLTKDDIVLLVGGKKREISFFSEETAAIPKVSPESLLPGVYSNQLALQPGIPNSLTAILFDTLNTKYADQIYAKRNVVEFLGQVQPQDRIAIFTLGANLRVLHDFSNDSSSLVRAIQDYKGRLNAEVDASNVESYRTGNPILDDIFEESNQAVAQFYGGRGVVGTLDALTSIADYFASIPGRKNLIWVSGSFPFNYGSGYGTVAAHFEDFLKTCRTVSNANVAIYPVEAGGLMDPIDILESFTPNSWRRRPEQIPGLVSAVPSYFAGTLQTMQLIADRTGGKAFYDTNDIRETLLVPQRNHRVQFHGPAGGNVTGGEGGKR